MSTLTPISPRPTRTTTAGPFTRVLRWVGILGALAITVWVLVAYPGLPETIPTHFDITGTADAWGSKSSILVLGGVMMLLSAGLALLSTKPRAFNYPLVVTEHNAQAIYREGERMMVWLLLSMQLIYVSLVRSVLLAGDGGVLLILGMAAMLGSVVVGIVRLVRAGR